MDITIIKKMIREEYPMQDIFDKIDQLQSEYDDEIIRLNEEVDGFKSDDTR